MTKKTVLRVISGLLALACALVFGPWLVLGMTFYLADALRDIREDRASLRYEPANLAEAVQHKYATPALVAKFIDRGEDVNQRVAFPAPDRAVPLVAVAARGGNVEIARLLIKRGARVGEADVWKCARFGRSEVARMLVEEGAPLGPQPFYDPEIGPELIQAAAFGHQAWLIKVLLAKGADVRVLNKNGDGLVNLALWSQEEAGKGAETTRVLISGGADVNATGQNKYTPLHWAAVHGKVEEAAMLLTAGAALEAQTAQGTTPLSAAVAQCQPESVAFLLSHGASREAKTSRGVPVAQDPCEYRDPRQTKRAKAQIQALLSAP